MPGVKSQSPKTAKRIWLFLLEKGGWWTGDELRKVLKFTRDQVYATLHHMQHRGLCCRSGPAKRGERIKYSVNTRCIVPDGVELGEIVNALKAADA